MTREISLKAVLNLKFANQAEYTSMRNKAIAFAAAQNGTYKIPTLDDPANGENTYTGKLYLEFKNLTRSQAANLMNTIDNELPELPDLVFTNGFQLKYNFEEIKV